MLIKIKNAYKAGHETVIVDFSKLNNSIASLLKKHNFIDNFEKRGKKNRKHLELILRYIDKKPALSEIKRISKLSKRVYVNKDKIYSVRHGYGVAVISTSKGLMTDKEARKEGVGGEVIAEMW